MWVFLMAPYANPNGAPGALANAAVKVLQNRADIDNDLAKLAK